MAINSLEKVYVFFPREKKEILIKELQKARLLHIETGLRSEIEEEAGEKEVFSQELDLKISQAEYIIEHLKKYEKKQTIAERVESARKVISYHEFQSITQKIDLQHIYNESYRLMREQKDLASEEVDINTKLERLTPYLGLSIDFREFKDTAHVMFRIGMMPEAGFKDFHLELDDISKAHTIVKIQEGYKGQDVFFIAYHKDIHEMVEKLFARYNYRDEEIKIEGTVNEFRKQLLKRLDEINLAKRENEEESILLADWLGRVYLMYDYLINLRDRKRAEGYLYETSSMALIKGWARKTDRKKLEEVIAGVTEFYDITYVAPEKGDNIPVEMINPRLVEPVEFVTSLYSTPKYDEIDPTIHIFPFFLFYFGVCLTDAGYGLMLLLITMILMRIYGKTNFLKTLLYGSLVTIVVGFFAGGYWGIDYNSLPEILRKFSVNLNENTLEFLAFSLFLGTAQLVYGFFLGAYSCLRKGDKLSALDSALRGVFFAGVGPVGIMYALLSSKLPGIWNDVCIKAAVISAVLFLLIRIYVSMKEFKFGGSIFHNTVGFSLALIKAVISDALLGLVNAITGFLGNMLSFSRLMALGLSSGGIGMVIILLAGLVKELIPVPVLGTAIAIFILVFGHLFNLVLSALGAFVHSARLQYVEFFPAFFEGGGRAFKPFSLKTKFFKVSAI